MYANHHCVQGMSQEEAQMEYMKIICSWDCYGSSLFDVEVGCCTDNRSRMFSKHKSLGLYDCMAINNVVCLSVCLPVWSVRLSVCLLALCNYIYIYGSDQEKLKH